MAEKMDDEELRRKLKEHGVDIAVTDSTRSILTAKYRRLSQQPVLTKSSDSNSRRRSLLSFSSDESESDTNSRSRSSGAGSAILGNNSSASESVGRRTRRSMKLNNTEKPGEWDDDKFAKPSKPLRRSMTSIDGRSPIPSPREGFSGGAMTPTRHHHQQRKSLTPSYNSNSLPFQPLSTSRSSKRSSLNAFSSFDTSDSDVSDSSISNIPENTGVDEFPTSRRSYFTSLSPSSTSTNSIKISTLNRRVTVKKDEHRNDAADGERNNSLINGHHGVVEEELMPTPNISADVKPTFTSTASESAVKNSSQCISMILVVTLAIFFVIIGFIYLCYRDQVPYNALQNNNVSICGSGFECLTDVSEVAERLKTDLRNMAGEHECGNSAKSKMTIKETSTKISSFTKQPGIGVNDVLKIFAGEKTWGIKFFDGNGDETDFSNPRSINYIASSIANLPWLCRIRKGWERTMYKVWIGSIIGVLITMVLTLMYYLKERDRKKKEEIYSMVERIMDILKTNYTADNKLDPYTPIPHVRDQLIPPAERSSKRGIWDAAVKFVQENESRVREEVRLVQGEDIAVWHWLPADRSPVAVRSSSGRLWQGQAFENLDTGVNAMPFSPTPCLKVRNMFDPETEFEKDWPLQIRNAVLEKCPGLDIVHIQVEESKQACVYIKCKDAQTAGKVYRCLHSFWFDGRLVTVKYLRLERYHERFPEAVTFSKPLTIISPAPSSSQNR